MKPAVSVIIPCYNEEAHLPEAIDSILLQSFQNFEMLLIDDCSTDGTPDILLHYQDKDKRINVIRNSSNLGIAGSMNRGIQVSRGRYIARMDADDISGTDRLMKQMELMEGNPPVIVCGSDILLIDNENRVIGHRIYRHSDKEIRKQLYIKNPFANPSVIIRKNNPVEKHLHYSNKYPRSEDYHIWFELAGHGEFRNINEPLLSYRITSKKTAKCRLILQDTISLKLYYLLKKKSLLLHPEISLRLLTECILLLLPAPIVMRLFMSIYKK